jgi:DNA repair photolyase
VTQVERKSAILSPSSLSCLKNIPSVNLTSGCAHDCVYCYARGYTIYPGDGKVVIYKNTLEKLKSEFVRKRTKPSAVYFSPSSDIFQPVPEVLELSYSVLEFLLSSGIGVAFVTKGRIPEKTFDLLLCYAEKVRAQIGIITDDDNIRRIFEPNAASVERRFEQMAIMASGGIGVEARIIPILPGITDSPDSIGSLLHTISDTGVKRAAISTLFLRPTIMNSLKRHVSEKDLLEKLLINYKEMIRLPVHAEHSSVIPLTYQKREAIYVRFKQLAKQFALDLSICGCMNPDIGGTCNITGKWLLQNNQLDLFKQVENNKTGSSP